LNDENTPAPTTNNNIWKYRYQELDINGNINQKGFVTFKIQNDNERGFLEVASYDSSGPLSSNKFEEKNKLFLSNVLYDVTNPQSRRTFLQFSPYLNNALDLNINFSNKTPITNFPVFSFHNDYSWTLTSEIIGSEQILYKGKSTNAIKVILNGQRPTGQGHCMQGQPGKIYIESWYVKDSKRYARQVVKEYNCSSIGNTLLTEETYELIQ
jgi:hypothetical protein